MVGPPAANDTQSVGWTANVASTAQKNGPGVPDPPEAWAPARRVARRIAAPVERFLAVEASSGIVLLLAALVALGIANSPLRESFEGLWHTSVAFAIGQWRIERDLHFVVNDGLMTIFFFVVGLEIRREIAHGELSQIKRAALPIAAALGGMVVPALIYLAFNAGGPAMHGWGVPMATDIAFAVGALALLGKRVAPALRILLLALAVIDDVGAIIIIALFYSSDITVYGFAIAGAGVVLILALQRLGIRSPWAYVPFGVVVWAGAYVSGIHPTLAGVIVGMLTPVRAWYGQEHFAAQAAHAVDSLRDNDNDGDERALLPHLDAVGRARREAISPVERLLHGLHGWVAYGIMPLFAFANSGVPLGSAAFDGDGTRVFLGVGLGLALGKPIGVLALSWLSTKVGMAALPRGVRWRAVSIVGLVAGIGFTMALFVANLAFEPGPLLETAKLAILSGSALAAVLGYAVGRMALRPQHSAAAAPTEAEAERSTDG
jgi:Na+:H+ antiporter, NhaA family